MAPEGARGRRGMGGYDPRGQRGFLKLGGRGVGARRRIKDLVLLVGKKKNAEKGLEG